jgi:nitric oxide reductase subunit C
MTLSHAKKIFFSGTIISGVIFLVLTFNSLQQFPKRTHEDKLDAAVVAGKWTWQKHNCNDCHTILGIGGYYAPDMTKVMSRRDAGWISQFLKDPHAVWPAKRRMPNLHLSDAEISGLTAFLTWVNAIDTNDWPPKPIASASSGGGSPGEDLFKQQGCGSCHTINGIGGNVGPDLSHIGSRRSEAWIEKQIKDPKSHFPNSIMPGFNKLPEGDIKALARYLSGLK